jgi:hypothetical protein
LDKEDNVMKVTHTLKKHGFAESKSDKGSYTRGCITISVYGSEIRINVSD